MLRRFLTHLLRYYREKNGWWLPLIAGVAYSFALPPFNHETHWIFSFFPLLNFVILIPLMACAVQASMKRALLHCFIYGYVAAFGQYHWLVFDRVEGLWALVILGLFLASGVVALFYLAAALLFRLVHHRCGAGSMVIFPAFWVLIDYSRALGELAFPWAFLGYSFTPVLPLSQLASVTGVWGLTYIAVLGNTIGWYTLRRIYRGETNGVLYRAPLLFCVLVISIMLAGWVRMSRHPADAAPQKKIALLQSNIDQFRWSNAMLDTAFQVSESLVLAASRDRPDLMVLPESALLTFIDHRQAYRDRVLSWVRTTRIPLVFGSIDWRMTASDTGDVYSVYNTAFFADTGATALRPYYKNRLVPFSEALPFEGLFPILSRVNLGEADFKRGTEPTIFHVKEGIVFAPLICYESIFPAYVRSRLRHGANLMVNITNDGWFGRSSGPRHHAMMARMRSIENGVSLARCANSGISMFVDPIGRLMGETGLYERTILTRTVPLSTVPALYTRFGDWFVGACLVVSLIIGIWCCFSARNRASRTV